VPGLQDGCAHRPEIHIGIDQQGETAAVLDAPAIAAGLQQGPGWLGWIAFWFAHVGMPKIL
jgi:hypothetical protein